MSFEFDPRKSANNKSKHGIDFTEAQNLWLDVNAKQIEVVSTPEPRSFVIGKIADKYWTAVVTERNENLRLISVRRSRKKEIDLYEKNKDI